MWYFDLLKPYHDHVPVNADLSDLEEKIRWCRDNDDKCREIGQHAKEFYEKYVGRNALLDYVQMTTRQIARRFWKPPSWWEPPPPVQKPPRLRKPDAPCYEDRQDPDKSRLCTRCHEEKEAEEQQLEEEMTKKREEKRSKGSSKEKRRKKMIERAAMLHKKGK
jgi:Glycosyl transferase family 90